MKSISDLIAKLGSDFPWVRKGALNNIVLCPELAGN